MRTLALALLTLTASAAAQDATTPGAAGAEAVVGAYADALARGDREAAAQRLDLDELAAFAGLLRQLGELGGDIPFAVGPDDTPAEVFATFLDAVMGAEPMMDEALSTLRTEVLGSVPEGDSLRHVVVRSWFLLDGVETTGVEATTARWADGRWVVTFDEKMRQFQRGIEAAVARGFE